MYDSPQKLRGLNPCTEAHFTEQLDYLRTRYEMVSVGAVYQAAKAQRPGRFCALTFDDGLKEHYTLVLPLLIRYGIPGTFFLSGEILRERKISLTHKLHVLLLYADIEALVHIFHKFFGNRYRIDRTTNMNPRRRFDDVLTVNFKETLIALPLAERAAFINDAFYAHHDEKKIAEEFFLDFGEARAMAEGGMEIGAHGFRHLSFDMLTPEEQSKDIGMSKAAIEEAVGVAPAIFSYPHGRANTETLKILKDSGFRYGVIIQPEEVSAAGDPLLIPRYDTNDITIS